MQRKLWNNGLASMRISTFLLIMFAVFASIYVAGRLWHEAHNRLHLIKKLDKLNEQGRPVMSVAEGLKVLDCREQKKKLSAIEMELSAAKQEGFTSKQSTYADSTEPKKRPLVVVGILTSFGRKNTRDVFRKAWMGNDAAAKKLENEKGIIVRFVIGRSENRGDSMDQAIDVENKQTKDFIILENVLETPGEVSHKSKSFFAHAADNWDAEFYAKVNDDIYVNIDGLGATLVPHLNSPRAYIGCMKSGKVFSKWNNKWYEPEWWKFGEKKSYFRHASNEIYVVSRALAKFVSINRNILHTYAHDDVSVGSWFLGLDVKHVDERKFCCSYWSFDAICSA